MADKDFRIEKDSMGELKVPADKKWGAQTQRACLLYTSDAADEGLGVDLGGRRII